MRGAIRKKDLGRIKALLSKVYATDEYSSIARMGGLTNYTYSVTRNDGKRVVVRIPGDGTEAFIDREEEEISTRLAVELGIDMPLLYFGADGSKVTEYIPSAVTMNPSRFSKKEQIRQAAEILRTLHTSGVDTGVSFDVFSMALGYEQILQEKGITLFPDYAKRKREVFAIKESRAHMVQNVPCHNDPLCENWVLGEDHMYLIDWEYAGMNEGMWDLADLSIEAGYDEREDLLLLQSYLGRDVRAEDLSDFLANKIFVDYLWTLWASARIPYDGKPMEEWAAKRYERLKGFLETYMEHCHR